VFTECSQVGDAFSEAAYGKDASVAVAVNSFRKCGIWSFNDELFTDADFAPSQTTERPQEHAPAESDIAANITIPPPLETSRCEVSSPTTINPASPFVSCSVSMVPSSCQPTMTTSTAVNTSTTASTCVIVSPVCESSRPTSVDTSVTAAVERPACEDSTSTVNQVSSVSRVSSTDLTTSCKAMRLSPFDVAPLPAAMRWSDTRKRRKTSSAVLTDSLYVQELKKAIDTKKVTTGKQKALPRKRLFAITESKMRKGNKVQYCL